MGKKQEFECCLKVKEYRVEKQNWADIYLAPKRVLYVSLQEEYGNWMIDTRMHHHPDVGNMEILLNDVHGAEKQQHMDNVRVLGGRLKGIIVHTVAWQLGISMF